MIQQQIMDKHDRKCALYLVMQSSVMQVLFYSACFILCLEQTQILRDKSGENDAYVKMPGRLHIFLYALSVQILPSVFSKCIFC